MKQVISYKKALYRIQSENNAKVINIILYLIMLSVYKYINDDILLLCLVTMCKVSYMIFMRCGIGSNFLCTTKDQCSHDSRDHVQCLLCIHMSVYSSGHVGNVLVLNLYHRVQSIWEKNSRPVCSEVKGRGRGEISGVYLVALWPKGCKRRRSSSAQTFNIVQWTLEWSDSNILREK